MNRALSMGNIILAFYINIQLTKTNGNSSTAKDAQQLTAYDFIHLLFVQELHIYLSEAWLLIFIFQVLILESNHELALKEINRRYLRRIYCAWNRTYYMIMEKCKKPKNLSERFNKIVLNNSMPKIIDRLRIKLI